MSSQLDILALEPFYGGARKVMLETLMHYSRHRWTLLRLPPRRIERRLAAAAHWFSEQISRHWAGRVDVLFTSEAMNLGDLLRMVPALAEKPSIVYFHDNQLPDEVEPATQPWHVVNITTAAKATEIWFNSLYHLRTFLRRANSMIARYPELSGRSPLPELTGKAQLMPPPVDWNDGDFRHSPTIQRDPRMLFVDTRDADIKLLNDAFGMLYRRGEKYQLTTVGPVEGLDPDLPRQTIPEDDERAQIEAMYRAAVIVSGRPGAVADHYAVRGLRAGCWPIFPDTGVYPELLPASLHQHCLYSGRADRLGTQLQNVWWIEHPTGYNEELDGILHNFDAREACRAIDDRFEQLVIAHSIGA